MDEELVTQVVAFFGIDREEVVAHQWVDNGPGWAVLRLPTAEQVLALGPDLSVIPDAMVGAVGPYPSGSPYAFELRTFATRVGVAEHPVCRSMDASVAQWLISSGVTPSTYRVSQGPRVGRAGSITITTTRPNADVSVGGATTTCVNGTISI